MILVFGGSGQLGTDLAQRAGDKGVPLIALDRQAGDVAREQAVRAAIATHHPSLVVNAAAYTNVDKAESQPAEAAKVNVEGARLVAAACQAAGVPLIHISTDFVFDGAAARPYREDDPVAPLGVYGRTKADGEDAVRQACARHLILRTAWLFGTQRANFLKTVLRLAREKDEIRMVADQSGSPTATADLAEAILVADKAIGAGDVPWGTYHVAGAGTASRFDFARYIVEAQHPFTGRTPRMIAITSAEYPTPARRPKDTTLDSSKFASAFGFRAPDWRIAVDRAVAALLSGETPR